VDHFAETIPQAVACSAMLSPHFPCMVWYLVMLKDNAWFFFMSWGYYNRFGR